MEETLSMGGGAVVAGFMVSRRSVVSVVFVRAGLCRMLISASLLSRADLRSMMICVDRNVFVHGVVESAS